MGAGGYTAAEVDATPFPAVLALFAYWRENPPVNELLARVYDYKPKDLAPALAPPGSAPGGMSIAQLREAFPDGYMRG